MQAKETEKNFRKLKSEKTNFNEGKINFFLFLKFQSIANDWKLSTFKMTRLKWIYFLNTIFFCYF